MHTPATLWLTGLSASGKTTLAHALADAFIANGMCCEILDGDVIRRELSQDLGFSKADRSENIRRVAKRCREINDAGLWAIAALISPYRNDRALARATIGTTRFLEIYLSTSLAVCEARDPKGLYRRARAGEIANFTGINDPYEAPQQPDLQLDGEALTQEACVASIMALLQQRQQIDEQGS